jgi:hypothetical protein
MESRGERERERERERECSVSPRGGKRESVSAHTRREWKPRKRKKENPNR